MTEQDIATMRTSLLEVAATSLPNSSPAEVEAAIDEAMEGFIAYGNGDMSGMVRFMEVIAPGMVAQVRRDPAKFRAMLEAIEAGA
jgi:hypothetical protein